MKKLVLLYLVFSVGHTFARRGDEFNNGGSMAQINILTAYHNLGEYFDVCLRSVGCQLKNREREMLKQIKSGLSDEYANEKQVQFKSGKTNPGFFVLNGEVKIAITGSTTGSTIFINTDLINIKMSKDTSIPMSIPRATALFIHEMGHHHSIKDMSALDLLGAKVAALIDRHTQVIPLFPNSHDVAMTVVNQDVANAHPTVILNFNGNIIDLSDKIKKKVHCPKIFGSKKPYGYKLHNVHWAQASRFLGRTKFKIKGTLVLYCRENGFPHNFIDDYKVVVSFRAKKGDKKTPYKIKEKSIKVRQRVEPWIPFFDIVVPIPVPKL